MPSQFFKVSGIAAATAAWLCAFSAWAGPNLTPYLPSGWSDKIVVTRTNGGTTDSPNLLATDSLYLDWAVINSGTSNATNAFSVALYIDGVQTQTWSIPSLNKNAYTYTTGYPLGSLAPGTHVFKIVADSTGAVVGDNESDNSYTENQRRQSLFVRRACRPPRLGQ